MAAPLHRPVTTAAGLTLPRLGLGTWRMGESAGQRPRELRAIRQAIELGYRLFDTAEMYGEGGAETVLGQALAEAFRAGDVQREEVLVVSKVYPHNASRRGALAACARSRQRLGLDQIDLYLLHWRGSHPLADTVAAFHELQDQGAIGHWGVSNFDVDDLEALWRLPALRALGASDAQRHCACNQVWYSAGERGPEVALLPWLQSRGVALMAYSPIDQGALAAGDADGGDGAAVFARLGAALGVSAATVALAWLIGCSAPVSPGGEGDPGAHGGVCAIPKAVDPTHLRQNLAALDLALDAEALAAIDAALPRPRRKPPLAMN